MKPGRIRFCIFLLAILGMTLHKNLWLCVFIQQANRSIAVSAKQQMCGVKDLPT